MDRQAECWSPSQHFLPHLFVPGATTELNPLSTISTHPLFFLGTTTEPKPHSKSPILSQESLTTRGGSMWSMHDW